ncbi:hypothetical protein F4775DRAFT_596016 [Biscogniauxia sp. FL1348]|nr:hypothetical protein F4775DRAFT_596016 [Biscogniauxia sp. FL1348]
MSDARALLRAHRAENRIKHPHAAYSDAGKLLCKLCHETVKSESLWEGHIRGPNHKKALQALQQQNSTAPIAAAETETTADESSGVHNKRKHDDVDESMSDADGEDTDLIRKKRSKTDVAGSGNNNNNNNEEKRQTPPALGRRTSGTPVHGIEIAIPSRPATPLAGSNSATSTPKNTAPVGRSPLIGPESTSSAAIPPSLPISTESLAAASQKGPPATIPTSHPANYNATVATTTSSSAAPPSAAEQPPAVDEAEWAAFEAEMADEPVLQPSVPPVDLYAQASISAPALTAEQLAAKSQEEENERRKHLLEAEIADEREDATRALETEFEEMEELEGRVRRLKERRDELLLRRGGGNSGSTEVDMKTGDEVSTAGKGVGIVGKENRGEGEEEEDDDDEDDEEDDDDEDDEEEDDWDAFRFRT